MKKLWEMLKPIIYSYTAQYLIVIIAMVVYFIFSGNINELNSFDIIYKYTIIGLIITSIPISIYLFRKYRIKESKVNISKLLLMIPLGLSISLFYNMLTIKFQVNTTIDINIYLLILYLVIIAPIYEEIVFRFVSLRKAKENYSENKAIILISLVFALMHDGIFNMIYAFLIGLVLSYIYNKYKNIMYPIVLHISANLMSVCIKEFNLLALIISFIILLLITICIKKENHI